MRDFDVEMGHQSLVDPTQTVFADAEPTLDGAAGAENCAEQFCDPADAAGGRKLTEPRSVVPTVARPLDPTQTVIADAEPTLDGADERENCSEQFFDPAGAADEQTTSEPAAPTVANARALAACYPGALAAMRKFVSTEKSAMALGEHVWREGNGDLVRNNETGRLELSAESKERFAHAGIKVRKNAYPFLYHVKLLCSVAGIAMSPEQMTKAATFAECNEMVGCSPSVALLRDADTPNAEALLKRIRELKRASAGKARPPRERAAGTRVRIPAGQPIGDGDRVLAPVQAGEAKLRLVHIGTDGNELLADLSVAEDPLVIKKLLHALRGHFLRPNADG